MKRVIPRGRHCPESLQFFLHFGRKKIVKKFKFTKSCLYKFGDKDDSDKNKLFGVGFNFFPRRIARDKPLVWFKLFGLAYCKPQHWDSMLFAWNCNAGKIAIYPYQNTEGGFTAYSKLCDIDIGKTYTFEMLLKKNKIEMKVTHGSRVEGFSIFITPVSWWSYYIDMWFGGNRVAPHDIIIIEL